MVLVGCLLKLMRGLTQMGKPDFIDASIEKIARTQRVRGKGAPVAGLPGVGAPPPFKAKDTSKIVPAPTVGKAQSVPLGKVNK